MRSLVDPGISRGLKSAAKNIAHRTTFKVGLETNEIAVVVIDHESDILRCHGVVGHIVEGERSAELGLPAKTGLVNGKRRSFGECGEEKGRIVPGL